MQFSITEGLLKSKTKLFRRACREHDIELFYTECLDLLARCYGYKSYYDFRRYTGDGNKLSSFDDDVSWQEMKDRFLQQRAVLVSAGFSIDVANDILEQVRPTGRAPKRPPPTE